jgi:CBS domain containing-hemolysin-like protein
MPDHTSDHRTVADAMVPLRDGCLPTNTAADVLEMVDQLAAIGMPVARAFDGEMLGVVLREDLALASGKAGAARIEDLSWQPVIAVGPETPLSSLSREPNPARVVLDAGGSLIGILDAEN